MLNAQVQAVRCERAGLDREVVQSEATRRNAVDNLGLSRATPQATISQAEKVNTLANFFVPMGLMMLMFMVIMVGASPLMQSVLEEKMQRIAEVLLGSVTPFQLMLGKLLGMVGVSLTIVAVYLAGGYLALRLRRLRGVLSRCTSSWWFVLFQALAVLMYGSLFIAIGAAVSDMKEAQTP